MTVDGRMIEAAQTVVERRTHATDSEWSGLIRNDMRQRKVNKWKQYITVSYLNQIILHVRLTAALRSFTVAWRCSSWNSNSDPLLVLRLLCLCCATRSCAFCEWVRTWKDFDNDVMNNGKKKSLSFGKSFSSGRLCGGLIRVYCVYLTCVSR